MQRDRDKKRELHRIAADQVVTALPLATDNTNLALLDSILTASSEYFLTNFYRSNLQFIASNYILSAVDEHNQILKTVIISEKSEEESQELTLFFAGRRGDKLNEEQLNSYTINGYPGTTPLCDALVRAFAHAEIIASIVRGPRVILARHEALGVQLAQHIDSIKQVYAEHAELALTYLKLPGCKPI